ncbi:serine hydrolase domain-containing protein [Pseudoduganella chitinolytica]|uniref:Serine hydrolase n=1 Tax=Pseudoduganella chitinolytica TaxID=34070 RepID=A0ABY8BEG4_9BURK|nr:serine hydrolase domain-containing protein [Pseudoduganella chitinolytica]WEF34091.1 serine hydrolase [Pseudoduganella chitinolytica]
MTVSRLPRRRVLQLVALAAAAVGCTPLPRTAEAQPGSGFNGVLLLRRDGTHLPLTPLQATLRFGAAPPAFAPGSRFDYSLTNWVVLAAIVEQVTGVPFRTTVTELVLRPAGTRDTGFADGLFGGAGEAIAYAAPEPGLPARRKMSPTPAYAAASGSLYSTAADLALLARMVYDGPLLAPASLAELGRVQVPDEEYALGGRVKRMVLGGRERPVAWLTGAVGGYKSLLAYVPGDGATVAMLGNMDRCNRRRPRRPGGCWASCTPEVRVSAARGGTFVARAVSVKPRSI